MITYGNINQRDFNEIAFLANGDGASTSLVFNADQPPFSIDYMGRQPSGFAVDVGDDTVTATVAIATVSTHTQITVTFSQPFSNGAVAVTLSAQYASL